MSARIFGVVYDTANQVIATATVVCPGYTINGSNGAYWFLTGGSATVDVTASAPNYYPQTKRITVVNGSINRLDFNLTHV